MRNDIERYHERREERLRERIGIDPVSDYRSRRMARLEARFDANPRIAYGIAKSMGIDTTGMGPQEVWAAIRKENPGAAKKERSTLKASAAPKGSGQRRNETGFVGGWKPPKVTGLDNAAVRKTLTRCNRIGGKYYDKASKVANMPDKPYLWTYTTHGMDHVQQVIDKTNQAADVLEKLPSSNEFKPGKIDRKTMLVAAWFHDAGMDGGDNKWAGDDGDGIRSVHGTNSALHVLRNAKKIESMGVNPSQVALTVFAHTKSKSKIKNLMEPEDWKTGVGVLQEAVKAYNARHKGEEIEFKPEDVFDGGEPNKKNIVKIASQVAALRLGDANREANGPLKSQSGGEYKIDRQVKPRDCANKDAEIDGSQISITDQDGRHELSANDPKMSKVSGYRLSKGVVLGEQNLAEVNTSINEKTGALQEEFTLHGASEVPWCTIDAILERCGELNTINGVPRSIVIKVRDVKTWDDMDENARRAYGEMWDRITGNHPKGYDPKTGERLYKGVTDVIFDFNGSRHSMQSRTNYRGPRNRNNRR